MTNPICIHHGNCPDGFTAGWVVKRALGDIELFAATHGEPPPDVTGRAVIMVDFSYKRPVLEAMLAQCESMVILDHHKTAEADLSSISDPKLRVVFDMERSGARIAWDYFHPKEAAPNLVLYVEDRDLWRFKLPESKAVSSLIMSYPYTLEHWDTLRDFMQNGRDLSMLVAEGHAIERKHDKDIRELIAFLKRRMTIGGHDVPVANLPYTMASDAGNIMSEGEKFAACYFDTDAGRTFSLRSRSDGMDVSEIAKMYGGGGHKNAAGFRVPRGHELAL